jgi:hypothetical protein
MFFAASRTDMRKGAVALLGLLCLHNVTSAEGSGSSQRRSLSQEEELEPHSHHHLPADVACQDGFPDLSRKYWWRYSNHKHPGLTDAFVDINGSHVVAVFNVVDDICSQCVGAAWWDSQWSAVYKEDPGVQYTGSIMWRDPADNTMMVQFPLPEGLPKGTAQVVSIVGQRGSEKAHYKGVPFCHLEQDQFFLVGCTEISKDFKYLAPEWIEYHLKQGYDRITLYANEDPRELQALLRPYVELGEVQIVDWHFPLPKSKRTFTQQETQENSCMQRYRGRAKWLASHDVDEFAQPMQPGQTVAGWLRSGGAGAEHIGAFAALTQFFGRAKDERVQEARDSAHDMVLTRFTHRAVSPEVFHRHKYIARPEHVEYTATHVTTGGMLVVPNSLTEIRFAHYKSPAVTWRAVKDESLARTAEQMAIRASLISKGYEPFVPVPNVIGFRLAK